MPINPNIALGIQPVQQPNILGQMGQIMAIRAAQEDLEGSADVKNYFAKPAAERGDPTELLKSKRGIASFKALTEGQEKQLDIAKKNVELVGAAAGAVLQNPTLENFTSVLSNLVQNKIYTPNQAQKALSAIGNDPSKIPSFVKPIFDQAISAEKRLTDITSRRGQDLSYSSSMAGVGATIRGQDITDRRLREQQAFERDKRNVIAGEGQFLQTDAYGNVYPVSQFGATRGPNAPAPAMPPAAANAFVTTQPSVNALAPTAPPVVQPGSPTVANALAIEQQNNVPKPKVPIRQPVAVIKDGQVTLVPPEQAVGMTPATPGAEKALEKKQIAQEGKQSVNRVLGNLYSEYTNLVKTGGITDTRKSVEDNISARTGASAVGQVAGSFTGSEAQSFRDSIEQTRPLLLTAIMKATGLSATQLNSNVELQTYLRTATDPKVSIQSNVKALNNISQMFGLGEKFDVPEIPKATSKAAKPADAPPSGLSPEIAGLWQYMTPEERKLWQK